MAWRASRAAGVMLFLAVGFTFRPPLSFVFVIAQVYGVS